MGLFSRRSPVADEVEVDSPSSASRFSSLWSRPAGAGSGRAAREPDPVVDGTPADGLKPSAMRGSEPLYGYVVGLELLVVAILNLTITHGKGAPTHPPTTLAAVGVAASIAFFAVIQTRNRMAAGFGAIVAAFFVTLPPVPNSMAIAHIFALVVPMAYGLIITQRQRRATPKLARRGAAPRGASSSGKGSGRAGARGAAGTAPAGRRGRRGKGQEPVSGPRPNARYTPPKSKRPTSK
ncbi:MAG TPA: hypothetical protein VFN68_13490 [Acidimicrobiales bacterium]|nr:hypothetical protein [Acidimicrobiales bacterium]